MVSVRVAPQTHKGAVVLLFGARGLSDVTRSHNVVCSSDVVKGHIANIFGVELLVGRADCITSCVGQIASQILGELTPHNLWLIPVLLVMREEFVVVRLVHRDLKLLDGLYKLVQANQVILLNEEVNHACKV